MFKTLIVEDNIIFRKSLKEIICRQFPSMLIGEATDCKEAIEKVHSFCPDLIFMDIKLPGGDGLQLTKKIKTQHGKIIIIIVTNYDLPEYRQAIHKCGASYFFSKSSSTRDEIVSLVESIVSDKRHEENGQKQ